MYLVLGLGVSGTSVVRFLKEKKIPFIVTDDIEEKGSNEQAFCNIEKAISKMDLVETIVASPGICFSHPVLAAAKKNDKEVICDIELALRYYINDLPPLIAITGTNGKTTTALLLQHILKSSDIEVDVSGNIGKPLLENLPSKKIQIVELSSFQLELISSPLFSYGVILNISPNHLDHHGTFEEYKRAKLKLCDLVLEKENMLINDDMEKNISHEEKNFLAAYTVAKEFGVSYETAMNAKRSFKKPNHRIEFVGTKKRVSYFNDSKATNTAATIEAVKSMQSPVVLLVGGVHKGNSYRDWIEPFNGKVRYIIAFGAAKELIAKDIGKAISLKVVETLQEAFFAASEILNEGDCLLLSPGCSSYDQFKNYEERGDEFKKLVKTLSATLYERREVEAVELISRNKEKL